ncbi:MAG TPA: hypothetical protein VGW33_07990 [Terriglobia bacterium]|nr:hypothetical protein [Terriglobia bacterium]
MQKETTKLFSISKSIYPVALGPYRGRVRAGSRLTRAALAAVAILLPAVLLPLTAWGQTRTTVTDTLYDPTGAPLTGHLVVTNETTFTSVDGFQIPAGNQITVTVTNGAFSVPLVPNLGATPAGTSYRVQYYLGSLRTAETWVVPQTPNPANLTNVRSLTAPVPGTQFAIAQVNPPSPCSTNFFLAWQGAGWDCAQPAFSALSGVALPNQLPGATATAQGVVQLAGDLGSTAAAPQVTSTHLAAALPVAQGGTGTATAFGVGSVVFAGSGGAYAQDSQFAWDGVNHRLGIGTATPTAAFHLFSSGTSTNTANSLLVENGYGGVGISAAEITARSIPGGYGSGINFQSQETGTHTYLSQATIEAEGALNWSSVANASSFLRFSTLNAGALAEKMRLDSFGNLGLGTTSPAEKLDVAGSIRSALNAVAFSSIPTFDASLGNTQKIMLTANVTSSTLINAAAGETLDFIVCQDSTGGRTFIWPSNVKGGMIIGATASKCSAQPFIFDGISAYALSPGLSNQ